MAIIIDNNIGHFIPGGGATDQINGNGGDDQIMGGGGPDLIDGGADIDTAVYIDSLTGVTIVLGNPGFNGTGLGGTAAGDVLRNIENVSGSAFHDVIVGNNQANVIEGLDGDDTLSGGGGDDTLSGGAGRDLLIGGPGADAMFGGAGNDVYVFNGVGDTISEVAGLGIDTVLSSLSFSLLSGAVAGNVENVALTGAANINATGNALANTLRGNAGNNRLDGGTGTDVMIGGAGNDRYTVNSGSDRVDENAAGSGGVDHVDSSVTFSLRGGQVGGFQNTVENLQLTGGAAISGTGNSVGNRLIGNGAANGLMGLTGNDTVTGGGGADTFMFHAALNAATNVDTITDFDVTQDLMRLENLFMAGLATGALSAAAFHVGASANDASDRIIYNQANGNLSFDVDGTGAAAAVRFAILDAGLALTGSDFTVF